MNTRERFHAIMNFKPFDRLPVLEWAGWWDQTLMRWYREGLPLYITDRYEICNHLGLDLYLQHWLSAQGPECPEAPRHGAGIIGNRAEYERIRPLLYPKHSLDRKRLLEWATVQQRGEAVVWFTIDGFFWFPRKLLGIEKHLFAFYDQPSLLHDINSDLAEWMLQTIEELCDLCKPDFITFAEDMSYNHGPMISEKQFDEFMLPFYKGITTRLKSHDIMPLVDSDGDITQAAGWFEKAGANGILPLERRSGVDAAKLRKLHPEIKLVGHFDKTIMSRGERAMRAEFERLLPVAAQGGFLPACDHQTPPEVSYRDYQDYLNLFREYAGKAGVLSQKRRNS